MKKDINIDYALKLYNENKSLHKTSKILHISHIKLSKLFKENNVRINNVGNKRDISDKEIKTILKLYNNNETIDNISKKLHITVKKISKILNDNNIKTGRWSNNEKKENFILKKQNDFIKKALLVHKNENIDYSKVEYKNNRTPVLLIDRDLREDGTEYGGFWQTPSNHLKGQSHPDKRKLKISLTKRSNQDIIIERFKEVHKGENLDYSQVKYVNMHTKVKIIDRDLKEDGTEYGEYWQEPNVHLKGCGHPLKGILKYSKSNTSTTEEFIEKAKLVHNTINYNNFLQGKGCQKCGNILSKAEDKISDIISHYHDIERNNRNILNGMEIDIYVPKLKIGIEYNGLRWHSDEFKTDKYYHLNKLNKCNEKGIKLIQIFEDEYLNNEKIVLNKLFHILNIDINKPKIGARKCTICKISNDNARNFLDINHIQGYASSTTHFGAFYGTLLIAVMSFTKMKNEWILTRFASDYNYICQGIGGKLFKQFIKEYNPTIIKSFADRRWTTDINDNLYIKLGFNIEKILGPDYRYYNQKLFGNERKHKFNFRKNTLHKKYGFPLTMTENEMTKELGCSKIYDCGLIKYVWNK